MMRLDTAFYAIFQLDDGDEWSEERNWLKANPGTIYGRPSLQYLRSEYTKAIKSTQQKANFLTKNCNLFVNGADKWLDIDKVRDCKRDIDFNTCKHRKCYIGFDRSLANDITSAYVLFPDDDGGCTVFGFNLQTVTAINESTDYLQQIYNQAEANGDLQVITDASRIRNEHVKRLLRRLYEMLPNCEHIAYDPYKMKEVAMDLEDEGYPMLSVSQGAAKLIRAG